MGRLQYSKGVENNGVTEVPLLPSIRITIALCKASFFSTERVCFVHETELAFSIALAPLKPIPTSRTLFENMQAFWWTLAVEEPFLSTVTFFYYYTCFARLRVFLLCAREFFALFFVQFLTSILAAGQLKSAKSAQLQKKQKARRFKRPSVDEKK